jgi:hypothetical protein
MLAIEARLLLAKPARKDAGLGCLLAATAILHVQ